MIKARMLIGLLPQKVLRSELWFVVAGFPQDPRLEVSSELGPPDFDRLGLRPLFVGDSTDRASSRP